MDPGKLSDRLYRLETVLQKSASKRKESIELIRSNGEAVTRAEMANVNFKNLMDELRVMKRRVS
jgi:hypothetical protein